MGPRRGRRRGRKGRSERLGQKTENEILEKRKKARDGDGENLKARGKKWARGERK